MKPTKQPPGTERFRDEQRDDDKPKVGGHDWTEADDPGRKGEVMDEEADTDIESGGEQAGMGRGEKPRKDKQREP